VLEEADESGSLVVGEIENHGCASSLALRSDLL
jgi:hypothetical protein